MDPARAASIGLVRATSGRPTEPPNERPVESRRPMEDVPRAFRPTQVGAPPPLSMGAGMMAEAIHASERREHRPPTLLPPSHPPPPVEYRRDFAPPPPPPPAASTSPPVLPYANPVSVWSETISSLVELGALVRSVEAHPGALLAGAPNTTNVQALGRAFDRLWNHISGLMTSGLVTAVPLSTEQPSGRVQMAAAEMERKPKSESRRMSHVPSQVQPAASVQPPMGTNDMVQGLVPPTLHPATALLWPDLRMPPTPTPFPVPGLDLPYPPASQWPSTSLLNPLGGAGALGGMPGGLLSELALGGGGAGAPGGSGKRGGHSGMRWFVPRRGGEPMSVDADYAHQITERKRRRPRDDDPESCEMCGTDSTPEWRRGPGGYKSLCNACGLRYAKQMKRRPLHFRGRGGKAGDDGPPTPNGADEFERRDSGADEHRRDFVHRPSFALGKRVSGDMGTGQPPRKKSRTGEGGSTVTPLRESTPATTATATTPGMVEIKEEVVDAEEDEDDEVEERDSASSPPIPMETTSTATTAPSGAAGGAPSVALAARATTPPGGGSESSANNSIAFLLNK